MTLFSELYYWVGMILGLALISFLSIQGYKLFTNKPKKSGVGSTCRSANQPCSIDSPCCSGLCIANKDGQQICQS